MERCDRLLLVFALLAAIGVVPAGAAKVDPAPWTPKASKCPKGLTLALLGQTTGPGSR